MVGLYKGSPVDSCIRFQGVSVMFYKILPVGWEGSHVMNEGVVMVSDCDTVYVQFDE